MRDLVIGGVFLTMLVLGVTAPFVFSLGYVWVDTFYPQLLSYAVMAQLPVAMIMGVAAIGGYFAVDRRDPPRFTTATGLVLAFAVWITLTTTWAVAPDAAWFKWDWALKTVLFSAFIPFTFRSRIQIEAFLQVYVFSAAAHLLPWGLKTMVGGGGYESALGLLSVNAIALSESSNVAAVSIMFVPLLLVLRKHSLIMPTGRIRDALYLGFVTVCLAGAIGSFARTAIAGFAVMGIGMWIRSKRKAMFTVIALVTIGGMSLLASDKWAARISTVQDYQSESSAAVRLLVWKWTLDFSITHPLGGGFNSFYVNTIVLPGNDQNPEGVVQHGRAFHSLYFELLGEHGWPGVILYFTLVATSLRSLQAVIRRTRKRPELEWAHDLAQAVQISMLTMLTCGAFIGISFQAMLWDLFALAICVREYVHRVERGAKLPTRVVAGELLLAR